MFGSVFKKILIITTTTITSLLIIELAMRFLGYSPWSFIPSNNPSVYKFDEKLGWKSKKGFYEIVASEKYKVKSQMNILDEGNRVVASSNKNKEKIIIIGGSFTQGWGVNDEDTFSFRIQKKFNNYKVKNFGQGGFGSVQSYLLLEDVLKKNKNVKLIVYGFIDHHEYRNVARGEWLGLLLRYSNIGYSSTPKVPYALIDKNDKIIFHKPTGYLRLPFRENSSLITLIEKSYMRVITKSRKKQQKKVLRKLVFKMNEISKQSNSEFLFVNLKSNIEEHKKFLLKNNIDFVDCNLSLTEEFLVKGNYHPNAKAHSFYGKCINNEIIKKKLFF
jgi:hypothetical protein